MMRLAAVLTVIVASLAVVAAAMAAPPSRAAAVRTYLACGGKKYGLESRPARCVLYGPEGTESNAGMVDLARLRWRTWSRTRARARGVSCDLDEPCANIPVRVTARRPQIRCGKSVFTRVRVEGARFGRAEWSFQGCFGSIGSHWKGRRLPRR
jgi:hypothetical protein